MRSGLTIEDVQGLFERRLLGTMATYGRDGRVLLSPVWFEWWEGGFHIAIPTDDVKARHLRHDPRASVVVAEVEPPMRGIEVRGTVTLSPTRDEVSRRIAVRYMEPDEVEPFLEAIGEGTLVRLEPGRLRVWDYADE
jgi:PPOX class probable F420-dependent enzyme